jgi:hypothetical protein
MPIAASFHASVAAKNVSSLAAAWVAPKSRSQPPIELVRETGFGECADLRKGRAVVVLLTAAMFAGAALCAYLWWSAVKSARHY